MDESKKQRAKIADISTMTEEQLVEFLSLDKDHPGGEEYSRRVNEFYEKHNLRNATLEEKWAMDSEQL